MSMKASMKKYAPMADRFDKIVKNQVDPYDWHKRDKNIRDSHAAGTLSEDELRAMSTGVKRANKIVPLLAESLKILPDELDATLVGGGYNMKIKVFFCHKNKLRSVSQKVHGVYSLDWGLLVDILEEMEIIYSAP
tara:strand:- start:411 stop:815 length:405 start_codon:yes stop_codon:yes gene_type:complete